MSNVSNINAEVMLPVGRSLQMGKYRVDSYLSSGGFGNTYVVTNTQFEERRALKEFFMKGINERDGNNTTVSVSNAANRPQFDTQREKFKKEARRLRRLRHPNIVGVDDLFDENGTTYYVMDYVEGGSLSERVKQQGMFGEEQVRTLLPPLLDALEYIHNQQMWHLDLKPGNILLTPQGQPVIIDFGASKQMGLSDGKSLSTGMTYTPGYAPSEQVDQNFDRIGPWTDLYALGGTLFNLLTGLTPPSGSDIQDLGERAFQFPPTVSSAMRKLIVWMMQPSRRQRPQSVAQVRRELHTPSGPVSPGQDDDTVLPSPKQPAGTDTHKPGIKDADDTLRESQSWWQRLSAGKKVLLTIVATACVCIAAVLLLNGSKTPAPKEEVPTEELVQTVTGKSFTSDIGEFTYTGPVDADMKPDGIGQATFGDGRVYNGPFSHGQFHGTDATFQFKNGDVFTGEFRNNLFYYGRYTVKSDGSYFVGTFKQGQPDEGAWYDKNGNKLD